jgi:Kef-type K+ transport system membrane component KefB
MRLGSRTISVLILDTNDLIPIPLIAFLIWLMRQDKRKGKIGIIVVIALVIFVISYMYYHNMFNHYIPVYD